ncbi:SAG family member [Eimeria brunetti]|uniref:SAG family member n=1 Tax=Eimeria brunetti TaxID=51314 RepID=U6LKY8_9EIME|nr:SAG family member [Eimeria brunetti]
MMAALALVSLGGLSLLLLQVTAAAELPTASIKDKLLPEGSEHDQTRQLEDFWPKACEKILGPSSDPKVSGDLPVGTYAYFRTSESTGNCAAAVEYWKGGLSLFENKLPEKYSTTNSGIYGNEKAVSFVALFNPKPSPKVSCAFVKCSPATTTTSTKATAAPGAGVGGRRLADGADESTTTNAVVCLTSPEALVNDTAPFSQEQWDKITQAMSNGVFSPGPTALVALAAAALSASVLM